MDWFTDIGYEGLPVEALKRKADLFNEDLSAGPYMIASRQRGGATVLKRFDKYFDPNEGKAPRIGLNTSQVHGIAVLIKTLARHWVGVDDEHLNALKELCSRVDPSIKGMTAKNRGRARPSS